MNTDQREQVEAVASMNLRGIGELSIEPTVNPNAAIVLLANIVLAQDEQIRQLLERKPA